MNRPRLLRVLRIAWSVAWGIGAGMLCVLWASSYSVSYHQTANFNADLTWGGAIGSDFGRVLVCVVHMPTNGQQNTWLCGIPYWYLLLLSPAAIATPWMRWRFSIRTLLLATTVIAVALGLGVW